MSSSPTTTPTRPEPSTAPTPARTPTHARRPLTGSTLAGAVAATVSGAAWSVLWHHIPTGWGWTPPLSWAFTLALALATTLLAAQAGASHRHAHQLAATGAALVWAGAGAALTWTTTTGGGGVDPVTVLTAAIYTLGGATAAITTATHQQPVTHQ